MPFTRLSCLRPLSIRYVSRSGRRLGRDFLCWLLVAQLWLGPATVPILAQVAATTRPTDAPSTQPATMPTLPSGLNPSSHFPLANPIITSDVTLKAARINSWREGPANWLLLDGDVFISMGLYQFRATRAAVRIDVENAYRTISHLEIYLDNARPGDIAAAVWAKAPRLLVTASTTGQITFDDILFHEQSAAGDPFVVEAAGRIQRYLASISSTQNVPPGGPLFTAGQQAMREQRQSEISQEQLSLEQQMVAQGIPAPPPPPLVPRPTPGEAIAQAGTQPATTGPAGPGTVVQVPPSAIRAQTQPSEAGGAGGSEGSEGSGGSGGGAILPPSGALTFSADKYWYEYDRPQDNVAMLMGNVRLSYQTEDRKRSVELKAGNAVIFLDKSLTDQPTGTRLSGKMVTGIYLEDNVVITDGDYSARAPRVYYDLRLNKAVMLDAVLYAYDVQVNVPMYLRASELRQESRNSWSARHAVLTTSEFAEPQFSVASSKLTLERRVNEDGTSANHVTASNNVFKIESVPIGWLPYLAGDADKGSMESLNIGVSSKQGPVVTTNWDMFHLLGIDKPSGLALLGKADWLGSHGAALGEDFRYDRTWTYGHVDSLFVPSDNGHDDIGGRNRIDNSGETRGYFEAQHREVLPYHWELSLEGAYISDPTFLEEFNRQAAETAKPYETSLYLKRQEDDSALTVLGAYDFDRFTPQTPILEAPGYRVAKLPELGYNQVGTSFWGDRLTFYSENRLTRMQIQPGFDTPADRGFTDKQSMALFGIHATTRFSDALAAAHIPTDDRLRLDTRQEIDAPLKVGIVDVTPYVVGRVTAYDQDFDGFSHDDDQVRLWGSVGTRLHTQFNRTFDNVDWSLLDVHRLRHIIEPSADFFLTGSTLGSDNLSLYDDQVENLDDTAGIKLGLRNTWQTQRGGPARYRSVDWVMLDTDVILRAQQARTLAPLEHFYDFRPEYGTGGDYFYSRLLWMVSDSVTSLDEVTYDMADGRVSVWRAGLALRQSPRLEFTIDYTDLEALHSHVLTYGVNYLLTRKYAVAFYQNLDLNGGSRTVSLSLERKLVGWRIFLVGTVDTVNNVNTLSFELVPNGQPSRRFIAPIRPNWPE